MALLASILVGSILNHPHQVVLLLVTLEVSLQQIDNPLIHLMVLVHLQLLEPVHAPYLLQLQGERVVVALHEVLLASLQEVRKALNTHDEDARVINAEHCSQSFKRAFLH